MKDSEILCINNTFPKDYMDFYLIHNVKIPEKDKLYSCRDFSKNSKGELEILLNEIINKPVPIKHPILGISYKEVAWSAKRFTTLLGEPISEEMLKQFKEDSKKEKELVKIPLKSKENEEKYN